jgi:2-polyprenyl-3-methyl-5-hydroxy-6-metoxy-1,4-benzoquinol methylase
MRIRAAVEHMIAVTYGITYDAVVTRFGPYEAMVAEIAALVTRSAPATDNRRAVKVLDIACGIGNVGLRLARAGYSVVGIDAVRHLIAIAREKHHAAGAPTNLTFHHLDLAHDPLPGAGTFDVLVSMHTLYWHPEPETLLASCRRALKPGGHAVFLTYGRPARIARTFREVRAAEGLGAAVRALRWLVPTAVFELFRDCEHRYLSEAEFHTVLAGAGFDLLESRPTFLAGLSHLAWVRARE